METHPFDAAYDQHSFILILGSFPSVKSREEGFYYGHPQNRFWRVLANVYQDEVPISVEEKKKYLAKHNLALWDVVKTCEIKGSADSTLKNEAPNDLEALIKKTAVHTILLNGKTAEKVYKKYFSLRDYRVLALPSTSPANAVWSLDKLVQAWGEALKNAQLCH